MEPGSMSPSGVPPMVFGREPSYLFESLLDMNGDGSQGCRVTIPDTLIFRQDASGSLNLSCWLSTSKSGVVVRKSGADAAGHVKRLYDKLSLSASSPEAFVASAFGSDGVPHGVPVSGLNNLLTDLSGGTLEGILMLQARSPGPRRGAIAMEVEYVAGKEGKAQLRAKLPVGDTPTAAASTSLKAFREELQATAKRVLLSVEANRKVRVMPGLVLEFVNEKGVLSVVGARGLTTSAGPGEAEMAAQLMFNAAQQKAAGMAVAAAGRGSGSGTGTGTSAGSPSGGGGGGGGGSFDSQYHNLPTPGSDFTFDANRMELLQQQQQRVSGSQGEMGSGRVSPAGSSYLEGGSVGGSTGASSAPPPPPPAATSAAANLGWGQQQLLQQQLLQAQSTPLFQPGTMDFSVPSGRGPGGPGYSPTTAFLQGSTPLPIFDLVTPIGGQLPGGGMWGQPTMSTSAAGGGGGGGGGVGSNYSSSRSVSPDAGARRVATPRGVGTPRGGGRGPPPPPEGKEDRSRSHSPNIVVSPTAAAAAAATAGRGGGGAKGVSPGRTRGRARGRSVVIVEGEGKSGELEEKDGKEDGGERERERGGRDQQQQQQQQRRSMASPYGSRGASQQKLNSPTSTSHAAAAATASSLFAPPTVTTSSVMDSSSFSGGTGPTSPATTTTIAALKRQLRVSEAALAAEKARNDPSKSDPPSLAYLRATGRFQYTEEPIPPPESGRGVLLALIQRLQSRWRDALDLTQEVKAILVGEKAAMVAKLQESHQREMKEARAAASAGEDALLQAKARLEATVSELVASQRREAQGAEKMARQSSEIKRLTEDLHSVLASGGGGSKGGKGGGAKGGPQSLSPKATPSSSSTTTTTATAAGAKRVGGGPSALRTAAADTLGMSKVGEEGEEGGGEGSVGFSASSSYINAPPPTASLQLTIRQLQDEVELLRSNLASEARSRTEAAAATAAAGGEHRRERARLAAQVSALEEAERARVRGIVNEEAKSEGGTSASEALLAKTRELEALQGVVAGLRVELSSAREDVQAAASSRMESAARLEALLPLKSALEAELVALRSEVGTMRGNVGGVLAPYAQPPGKSSQISILSPPPHPSSSSSADADTATAGRPATPSRSTASGGGGVDGSQPLPSSPLSPSALLFPSDSSSSSSTAAAAASTPSKAGATPTLAVLQASIASERAAATRAVVEATLLRNELKGLSTTCEKAQKEALAAKQALLALKATRTQEVEAAKSGEAAKAAANLEEYAAANRRSMEEAIAMARGELLERHAAEAAQLRAEAESSSKVAAELTTDVARLRAEVSTLTSVVQDQRKRAAALAATPTSQAEGGDSTTASATASAATAAAAAAKEEVYSLQAQLTATQSTVIALRKESAHLREAAAASLNDLTQSYTQKFAALQQIHAAEVVAARQAAQEEASRALAQAVASEKALASRDTEVALAQGRLALEQERMRGEEERTAIVERAKVSSQGVVAALLEKAALEQSTAVTQAVQMAQWEWEKVTAEALGALNQGKEQSAAVQASAAALAAKKEVESKMGVERAGLEGEVAQLRAKCMELLGEVGAKDRLLAAQAASTAEAMAEAKASHAALMAAAAAANVDAISRALAMKQVEMETALVAVERSEAVKWGARVAEVEERVGRVSEERVGAAVAAARAALAAEAEAQHKAAMEKAVGEALGVVSTLSSETNERLVGLQSRMEGEKAEFERAHAAKVAQLQGVIATLNGNLEAQQREAKKAAGEAAEALFRARSEATQERDSLRAQVVELRNEAGAAGEKAERTYHQLRAMAEGEIRAVKERAAQDVASAVETAEARALSSVDDAVSRTRALWQKEMERAVAAAVAGAREEFLTQLRVLSSSADTQFSSQAELMRMAEGAWGEKLRAMEQAGAQAEERAALEVGGLTATLATLRTTLEGERSAALAAARAGEEDKVRAVARAREEALGEARLSFTKEREEAVRAATASTLASAQSAFEAERAGYARQTQAAMSAMASEADALVAAARREAARERDEAVEEAMAKVRSASNDNLKAALMEASTMGVVDREKSLLLSSARHAEDMMAMQVRLAQALDAEVVAKGALAASEERGRAGLREAEERLGAAAQERLREAEAAWGSRAAALQANNEQAATIIAGLLKEADEATQSVAAISQELATLRARHGEELVRLAGEAEELKARLEREFQARFQAAMTAAQDAAARSVLEVEDRCNARLSASLSEWSGERARLLGAVQEAEARRTAMNASQGMLTSTFAQQAEQLQRVHSAEMDALRAFHDNDVMTLTMTLRAEHKDTLERALAEAGRKAAGELAAALERSNARVAELESAVSAELAQASKARDATAASALAALQAEHSKAIDALKEAQSRMREEMAAASTAAAQNLARLQAGYEAELAALRDASLPLSVITELRSSMESQASAAVTSAVEEAVTAGKRDTEALRVVLQQRFEEADGDRKQLSATLDMVQEAVTSQLAEAAAAVRAAEERANLAAMSAEDSEGEMQRLRSQLASHSHSHSSPPSTLLRGSGDTMTAEEAKEWVGREVAAARASLEAELEGRGRELSAIAASQANSWSGARETMLSRIADLEALLTSTRVGAAEASGERDATIADLRATVRDLGERLAFAEGEMQERLRVAMREAVELERGAFEERARSALAQAVLEAVEAGIRDKEEALAALRAECEARLAEFEAVAAQVRAAERAALEKAHREQVEAMIAQAMAERDALSQRLEAQRAEELLEAQEQAAAALERARQEGEAALAAVRASAEEQRNALAQAAGSDLGEAMGAARAEMSSLLGSLDQEWQQRSDALLAAQSEQNQKALTLLLEASRQRLEECTRGFTAQLMQAEEERTSLLLRHAAYVPTVLATLRAELEADKVRELAAFNAEWTGRMEERVAELMDARSAELAALKEEYQAHMDSVVSALEAQRQGALSAFSDEFKSEREKLLTEKVVAVAEAIKMERGAAERNLAMALARAEEEKQLLLVEQAERLAEERAQALAALRQQATEEHEEANDALRLESEKLLMSIEGAMSKLRDERDVAAEDREVLRRQLQSEKEVSAALRDTVGQLKRAGSLATLKAYILAGKYVSVLAAVRAEAEARRQADLAALEAKWEARLREEVAIREEWTHKFYVLCETREELVDALTNFKRDLLVQHKVKCTTLAQEVAALSTQRAELQHDILVLTSQVKESEGGIRTLEKTINDMNKESVIGAGGVINDALQKRKNRLSKDMDSAIVRLEDRRKALMEVADKAKKVEDARTLKEAELKQVEANLVSTLVAQQRQLKAILDAIPLTHEEMEVPREVNEGLDVGGDDGGGGEPQEDHQQHQEQEQEQEQQHHQNEQQGMGVTMVAA